MYVRSQSIPSTYNKNQRTLSSISCGFIAFSLSLSLPFFPFLFCCPFSIYSNGRSFCNDGGQHCNNELHGCAQVLIFMDFYFFSFFRFPSIFFLVLHFALTGSCVCECFVIAASLLLLRTSADYVGLCVRRCRIKIRMQKNRVRKVEMSTFRLNKKHTPKYCKNEPRERRKKTRAAICIFNL